MKHFITKKNIGYRFQQFVIIVLHLILLRWMYFTLASSGLLTTTEVLYHFIGIAIMGTLLIRGCAYWANYHFNKEQNARNEE